MCSRINRPRILFGCFCSVILLAVPVVSAEVKKIDITEEKGIAYVLDSYHSVAKWPTDAEVKRDVANADEIRASLPAFEKWTKRVLADKYVPANLRECIFGLKKWDHQGDVLFADYQVNDIAIYIQDSPTIFTVRVVSDKFGNDVTDWEQHVRNFCKGFLSRPERLLDYTKLYVCHVGKTPIRRIDLLLPRPEKSKEFTELWHEGNPCIWMDGKSVIVTVTKVLGMGRWPDDSDFGVAQRFPPLSAALAKVSTKELATLLANEKNSRDRDILIGLLVKRPDSAVVIPQLISLYEKASKTDDDLRMSVIQNLGVLARTHGEAYRERVRELATKSLQEEGNTRLMNSVLNNVVNSLKDNRNEQKDATNH